MDLVDGGALEIQSFVDVEDLPWQPCPDFCFSSGLSLRRRQKSRFLGLFHHTLLRTGPDDGHEEDVVELAPWEFYPPNQIDQRTRGEKIWRPESMLVIPIVRLLGVWIVENRGFLQKLAIGKRFRGKQQLG
jgi:hypothetical protein